MMSDLKVWKPLTLQFCYDFSVLLFKVYFYLVFLSLLCFFRQILMSASTTLASTASASTPTALSGVNAPWDSLWTSAASDAKASSFPSGGSGVSFMSRLSNATSSACGRRRQRVRVGRLLRQRHLYQRGGRLRVRLRRRLRARVHDDL